MSRPLVIYHGPGCPDGFTAAWVAWQKLGDNAEYLPAQHGDAPPLSSLEGREVYVLDFSYPREVLVEMHARARSLLVLDHHKSAQEALAGLDFCRFDMHRSGAKLAADHFGCAWESTRLVDYVEDRDLWRWKLVDSKEINAAIGAEQQAFLVWTQLAERLNNSWGSVSKEGAAILRAQAQLVERITKTAREMLIGGHKVLFANAPVLQSEVGEVLAQGRPFGATWYAASDGKTRVSLRSTKDGIDVAEIAKLFGGGGHRNAAGFEIDEEALLGSLLP